MCEDCFASRFLNELGALPESETPMARDDETPRPVPDYFTCPSCNQELLPSFWESFPHIFTHARQSVYCKPQLTLFDVHARIIASVLRKLRCDPLAAVARCPDSSQSAGRYAIAFDVNHEVACFCSTFDSIIDARTVTAELGVRSYGISEVASQNWAKILQDVKTFENRAKKLNNAGNRMRFLGSHYYCGKEFTSKYSQDQMASVKRICRSDNGQCQDCLVAEAELAQEIQPQFVTESERGDREKDIRMCPRCFGGYFINMWCNDLAAHQGEAKEFQVKNVCPDCGYFSTNWADYPKANEKLKEQKLRSRMPYLKSLSSSVSQVEKALIGTLATVGDKRNLVDAVSGQLVGMFIDSAACRMVVRRLMVEARRAMIAAAIESTGPALTSTASLARLILLFLGTSGGYCNQFCFPLELGCNKYKNSDVSIICAVLMAFAALQCWSPATLENILSGDVGEKAVAQQVVKRAMDQALAHVASIFPHYLQKNLSDRLISKMPHLAAFVEQSKLFSPSAGAKPGGAARP